MALDFIAPSYYRLDHCVYVNTRQEAKIPRVVLSRMKRLQPTGRIVLELAHEATLVQTQMFYQLGLGAAALKVIRD